LWALPLWWDEQARPYVNNVLERVTLEQLHGDEGPALVLVYVVNGADVGMVEG
jgi:hypothetical protein